MVCLFMVRTRPLSIFGSFEHIWRPVRRLHSSASCLSFETLVCSSDVAAANMYCLYLTLVGSAALHPFKQPRSSPFPPPPLPSPPPPPQTQPQSLLWANEYEVVTFGGGRQLLEFIRQAEVGMERMEQGGGSRDCRVRKGDAPHNAQHVYETRMFWPIIPRSRAFSLDLSLYFLLPYSLSP